MKILKRNRCLVIAALCGLLGCKETANSHASDVQKTQQKTEYVQSLPFLVVDLDGDGIELIPLEESNVYFDVDGDGLAERTAWIHPDEAFLGVFSHEERRSINETGQRIIAIFTGGINKIVSYDINADRVYEGKDYKAYKEEKIQELGFLIAKDEDLNGIPETQRNELIDCDFESFSYGNEGGTLSCKESKTYKVWALTFAYEDSNVLWEELCHTLHASPGSREEYQSRCLDHGFNRSHGER